jgi:hypothetical protein
LVLIEIDILYLDPMNNTDEREEEKERKKKRGLRTTTSFVVKLPRFRSSLLLRRNPRTTVQYSNTSTNESPARLAAASATTTPGLSAKPCGDDDGSRSIGADVGLPEAPPPTIHALPLPVRS